MDASTQSSGEIWQAWDATAMAPADAPTIGVWGVRILFSVREDSTPRW